MRIDLYTKLVLTIIAVCLVMSACKSLVQPLGVAADGPFAGVQFSLTLAGLFAIDTKTGEMWLYGENNAPKYEGRLTKLGGPIDLSMPKK
jgi:hypothetical protein